LGANSGSVLATRLRVRRQRTFSASKIRRTWLRPAYLRSLRRKPVVAGVVNEYQHAA